jgi:TM2 domain-containing membrane protein YozV
MDCATKAALFSTFLFPGWGQIYLKRYKRGIAIIVPVLSGALSICWSVIQVALNIIESAPFKKGAVSVSAVIKLSINSVQATDIKHVSLILLMIISLWLFSIFDAYLLAKKQIQKATSVSDNQAHFPDV